MQATATGRVGVNFGRKTTTATGTANKNQKGETWSEKRGGAPRHRPATVKQSVEGKEKKKKKKEKTNLDKGHAAGRDGLRVKLEHAHAKEGGGAGDGRRNKVAIRVLKSPQVNLPGARSRTDGLRVSQCHSRRAP